jgi:hypothetical protein
MLKKLYLIVGFVFLALVLPAQAQHGYHGYQYRHHLHNHNGHHWLAPMIVGGVITYVLTRPQPQVVQQPSIVLQPGQQLVCERPHRVFNSLAGVYEIRQECWVQ